MTHAEAVQFLHGLSISEGEAWADIGAGTGIFTMALSELLGRGTFFALDKSPHMLWRLVPPPEIILEIVDANFMSPLPIDPVDGMLMANALHYSPRVEDTLKNILDKLKPGGQFVLIEYETTRANPYVPYPVTFSSFQKACSLVGLSAPVQFATRPSQYGHSHIYGAVAVREE